MPPMQISPCKTDQSSLENGLEKPDRSFRRESVCFQLLRYLLSYPSQGEYQVVASYQTGRDSRCQYHTGSSCSLLRTCFYGSTIPICASISSRALGEKSAVIVVMASSLTK